MAVHTPLPPWFKQDLPDTDAMRHMQNLLREKKLHTVCQSARCPNIGTCWRKGTATFMILGDVCTRRCRFCAVVSGQPVAVDSDEPHMIADAVAALSLSYVVITSVTRDDLSDGGAAHFAETITAIRAQTPRTKIEVLIPDFNGNIKNLRVVIAAHPDVIGHNTETIARLTPVLRPSADYQRSLALLQSVRDYDISILTKSGIMVGLGESDGEIFGVMKDLRSVQCDILTIGQYLSPSKDERHVDVQRYVLPEDFERYKKYGMSLGFRYIASGPLVRSSYMAEEGYAACSAIPSRNIQEE